MADRKEGGLPVLNLYQKTDAVIVNVLLAALFSNFILHYYIQFTVYHKFSAFLMMVQITCLVIFFLLRVLPRKVSFSKKDWAVALCGTWLPLLILPTSMSREIPLFLIVQLIGVVISTIGILSLNKSFAIVPALRDVKTRGLYRFVRHPIYFGYLISLTCVVVQNFSLFNLCVLCGVFACDVMRILAEEKILREDDQYRAYMRRVKWRLLPFIW